MLLLSKYETLEYICKKSVSFNYLIDYFIQFLLTNITFKSIQATYFQSIGNFLIVIFMRFSFIINHEFDLI